MNTSEYYYILAIAIHVHENGTVNIHIHSSLFSKSFLRRTHFRPGQIIAVNRLPQELLKSTNIYIT